MQLPAKIA
ncbi:unnamed protein product [Lathyrus oleraceus]